MGTYPRKTEKKKLSKQLLEKLVSKCGMILKILETKLFFILIYIQNKSKKKKAQICLYVDEQYNVKDCFNSFYSN